MATAVVAAGTSGFIAKRLRGDSYSGKHLNREYTGSYHPKPYRKDYYQDSGSKRKRDGTKQTIRRRGVKRSRSQKPKFSVNKKKIKQNLSGWVKWPIRSKKRFSYRNVHWKKKKKKFFRKRW